MASITIQLANVRFPPSFYRQAIELLKEETRIELRKYLGNGATLDLGDEAGIEAHVTRMFETIGINQLAPTSLGQIRTGNVTVDVDTIEGFLDEIRHDHDASSVFINASPAPVTLLMKDRYGTTEVKVQGIDRTVLARMANFFEDAAKEFVTPTPPPPRPRIFIGHGGSTQWQALHIYLGDQMGYEIEAFETLPRAGHTIKEVLDSALATSDIAILVMTAEDEQADESMRARQNVVHETGLFQGRLGFHRTIVLLEEGTEDFSNLAGLQELRYPAGSIRTTYGDIISTLQREFPA